MTDHAQNRTIVFNGEIYNFRALREQFRAAAYPFSTRSDTEVILAGHALCGDGVVSSLRGMFAFALWDSAGQSLLLARDRFGKKPLFYTRRGDRVYFASELKALRAVLPVEVDRVSLAQYLALGYVPGSRTIYRDIRRVRPGHTMRFAANGQFHEHQYWSLPVPDDRDHKHTTVDWERIVASRLQEAVRLRLISDVPVGAFLSGGLDSSTVVALSSKYAEEPFHTFSIRPKDVYSPDADAAQEVSTLLGTTDHEEILECPRPEALLGLMRHFDEPFADSSLIPTSAVSDAARRWVTVALSGDGGDEMFGGYGIYRDYRRLSAASSLPLVPSGAAALAGIWPAYAPAKSSLTLIAAHQDQLYLRLSAHLWNGPLARLFGGTHDELREASEELVSQFSVPIGDPSPGSVATAQWIDAARGYLAGDILAKVDMAAMGHSLEVRVPLLDHVLAEELAGLPRSLRMRAGRGKLLLRRIARQHLPEHIVERKKIGFTVPLARWLDGPLAPLVEAYVFDPNSPLREHVHLGQARRLALDLRNPHYARLRYSLLSLAVWAETLTLHPGQLFSITGSHYKLGVGQYTPGRVRRGAHEPTNWLRRLRRRGGVGEFAG